MPLTATIAPPRSAATAALEGVVAVARPTGAVGAAPPQPRAARGAGVGLGVEAAVGGVVVLGPARGAHREPGHRGGRPVVGHGDARSCSGARSRCSW